MGFFDRFLDAIKLNDDYDDDDFLDEEEDDYDDDYDEDEDDEEFEEEKPRKRFFDRFSKKKKADDYDDYDDEDDYDDSLDEDSSSSYSSSGSRDYSSRKETSAKKVKPAPKKRGLSPMEVNVIRPTTMEDTKDIADTLMASCTVVLNLEGIDVDTAQRIIDFTCGACYSLNGSLQRISSYIFILTPEDVDISGDVQSILSGAFDLPSILKGTDLAYIIHDSQNSQEHPEPSGCFFLSQWEKTPLLQAMGQTIS